MGLAFSRGHSGPDGLGFLQVAVSGIELPQSGGAVVAGGQLVELLLVPGRAFEIALFLRELRQLPE